MIYTCTHTLNNSITAIPIPIAIELLLYILALCNIIVAFDLYSRPPGTQALSNSAFCSLSLYPLFGALLQAAATLLELLVYKVTKFSFSHFLTLSHSSSKEQNSWPRTKDIVCRARTR